MVRQPRVPERAADTRSGEVAPPWLDRVQHRPLGVEPHGHRHDDLATTRGGGTLSDTMHQRDEGGGVGARHEGRLAVPVLGSVPPNRRKASGRPPGHELGGRPQDMGLDPPQHRQRADGEHAAAIIAAGGYISTAAIQVGKSGEVIAHCERPGKNGVPDLEH